jgi:hypothetical protein
MSRSALAVLALVLPVAALAQAGSSAPQKLPAAEKKTAASAKSSTPSGSNAAASKTTKVASSGKKTVPSAAPVSSTSSRTQLHSAAVQVGLPPTCRRTRRARHSAAAAGRQADRRADRADQAPPAGEDGAFLLDLLTHRVPPGVDDAAKVKASFLAAVAHGELQVGLISKAKATELLGTMVGGYNVHPLIELLDDADVAAVAAEGAEEDAADVRLLQRRGRQGQGRQCQAKEVMQSWADAEWFTSRPEVRRPSPSPCSRCPARPTPTT